jgi:hypothetical protein
MTVETFRVVKWHSGSNNYALALHSQYKCIDSKVTVSRSSSDGVMIIQLHNTKYVCRQVI